MNNCKSWYLLLVVLALGLTGCGNKNQAFSIARVENAEATEELLDSTNPEVIFLQNYAAEEGIIVRPSGLMIRIIRQGDGAIPTRDSIVTAQYHGTLIDGTVFDTTRDTGQPFSFSLNSVIDGWREAMMLMRVGSIFEIVMPADLAYGSVGAAGTIPPGATLVFEVELVDLTNPLKPVAP